MPLPVRKLTLPQNRRTAADVAKYIHDVVRAKGPIWIQDIQFTEGDTKVCFLADGRVYEVSVR